MPPWGKLVERERDEVIEGGGSLRLRDFLSSFLLPFFLSTSLLVRSFAPSHSVSLSLSLSLFSLSVHAFFSLFLSYLRHLPGAVRVVRAPAKERVGGRDEREGERVSFALD